jgi:Protein of unknown function (DUF3179)
MPSLRTGLFAAGGLLAAAAIAGGVYGVLTPDAPDESPVPDLRRMATPFIMPGKTRPPTISAAEAGLVDDEQVIGVVAGGRVRAYRVGALAGAMNQVVNDVLGGEPVTVTRCDQTGRVRVLTGDGSDPLPVMTGGFADGLLIKVGDRFYHHKDLRAFTQGPGPPFPYREFPFLENAWRDWRTAHPDTDVYVGNPGPVPQAGHRLSRPPGP